MREMHLHFIAGQLYERHGRSLDRHTLCKFIQDLCKPPSSSGLPMLQQHYDSPHPQHEEPGEGQQLHSWYADPAMLQRGASVAMTASNLNVHGEYSAPYLASRAADVVPHPWSSSTDVASYLECARSTDAHLCGLEIDHDQHWNARAVDPVGDVCPQLQPPTQLDEDIQGAREALVAALAPSPSVMSSPGLVAHMAGKLGALERERQRRMQVSDLHVWDGPETAAYSGAAAGHVPEFSAQTVPWSSMSPAEDPFGGLFNTSTTSVAARRAGGWAMPSSSPEIMPHPGVPVEAAVPGLWHTPAPVPLGV